MVIPLAKDGRVVIPKAIHDRLGLVPGNDFEIWIDDEDEIVLRQVRRSPNCGLAHLLRTAPGTLNISARERENPPPPIELE